MMLISEIKPIFGERCIIKLSDGCELKVSLSIVADFGLYSGKELSNEESLRLLSAAQESNCRARALRIIGARAMSRAELEKRLIEKGETPENAEAAVCWLEEIRLLDDGQYAGMLVRHYATKGYGRRKIQSELFRRKVPRELWDAAFDEMPEQDDKIDLLLRSKLSENPDRAEIKKATDSLARRGFSWDEIKSALERLRTEVGE